MAFGDSKSRGLVLATNQLFKAQENNCDMGTENTSSTGWKQGSAPGE